MTFKPLFLVLFAATPVLFSACSGTAPTPHEHSVLGAEQGYQSTTQTKPVRPVEGFEPAEPYIAFPAPPVDNPVSTDPKPRPDAHGLKRLSGYSLRQITEALNNHGEGERVSWYDDREQFQLRIDTHAYARNNQACKDTMLLVKHNTIHSDWRRHYLTFCRVQPQSPWKLQY